MNQRLLDAFAIVMATTGLGILLFLLPVGLNGVQIVAGLIVLLLLAGAIVQARTRRVARKPPQQALMHADSLHSEGRKMLRQRNEFQRYFAWVEKKLARLIEREALHCGLSGIKRGPLVITLRVRLLHPSQKDLQKLLKLGPALAQMLQVEAVRIADTAAGILIEVPSPRPLTPNGALLARYTRGFEIAVGVDTFSQPVTINLQDHGAVFWVGPSRRGKTQAMKSALYALVQASQGRIQFVIIASPAKVHKDWGIYGAIAGCLGIAAHKEEIAAATSWLVNYMNNQHARPTILLIDDLPTIFKAVPSIKEDLVDIASMGAGLGLHFWAGTQGAGSKRTSGGTEIENNVTARILYRPSTSRTGSQSAGAAGLALHQLSSAKGDALALIDGVATRIATAWISDRDIALLPPSKNVPAPWQHQRKPDQNHSELPQKPSRSGLKPDQNQRKPPGTNQNQENPGVTHGKIVDTSGHASGFSQHAAKPTTESVLEPSQKPGDIDQHVSYLATRTNNQLKQENLRFDSSRFPNLDEQRIIMLAYSISGSLNKACFICYGYKNPKIVSYIKPVIQSATTEMHPAHVATEKGIPDKIDLSTAEGQALFARLQQAGIIKLPDTADLIEEGD